MIKIYHLPDPIKQNQEQCLSLLAQNQGIVDCSNAHSDNHQSGMCNN